MTRVTNQSIDARIDKVEYHRIPNSTMTICVITMVNGFSVTGESACVDPNEYNKERGEEIAYENAFEKLWPLEGYLLKERLYQQSIKGASRG
jgi:hypothetical protein